MIKPIDIGISTEQRQQIADGLGRLLADTWVLYGKTHGFHWNVTGPMFNSLHGMFDTQYNELWDSLDEIAERIRALGMAAPFGDSTLTKLASIQEAAAIPAAMDMVQQLMADLLTGRLQMHQKKPGCCLAFWRIKRIKPSAALISRLNGR